MRSSVGVAWPVTASWVRGYPGARPANRCPYLAVALWGTDEERAAYRAATDSSHRHARSGPDRFFTTGFLPQRFRDELGLSWGPRRQHAFEVIMRAIGEVQRRGPQRRRRYPLSKHLADMRRRRALGKPLV
ncbi:oxygenase MpaB family protein [Nocardia farcinica]|uniref:oxygenase MpaB family protein n=1 Tax=Nocardia farcinica TaxID=37329 RepID=UPI00189560F5|nr:oxygenase MpaB family protein [Nocardia farcinica]MBF6266246.1 DUF2236 domain-containing protein [Nocardia farcinica]